MRDIFAYRELRPEVDEFVALMTPEPFYAVGQSYEDFRQTGDAGVAELLLRARENLASAEPQSAGT